jgi:hypothetical protein
MGDDIAIAEPKAWEELTERLEEWADDVADEPRQQPKFASVWEICKDVGGKMVDAGFDADTMSTQQAFERHPSRSILALTPDQKTELMRFMARMAGEMHRVWAGVPLISPSAKLVLHPKYPFPDLASIGGEDDIYKQQLQGRFVQTFATAFLRRGLDADQLEGTYVHVHETFYCHRRNCDVYILTNRETGKRFAATMERTADWRLGMWVSHLAVSDAWRLEAELKAQQCLRNHLNDRQWSQYVLTGTFVESSKKSNVIYLFRKGRPTIAMSGGPADEGGNAMFLAGLCSHGIGYYKGTFGGAMTPTDDLISHLLLMRADEWLYWKMSEQHCKEDVECGI